MDTHRTSGMALWLSACSACAGVLLAGCTSASYQKSDAAAYSMQTAAAEVQAESRALEQTVNSLKDLVNEPGHRPQQYQNFSTALDRLVAAAERTENTGKRMELKSAAYFQEWDRQLVAMDYDHIRDVSQARKTEVTNHYAAVSHRYKENQDVVQPLIGYLLDLRRALGTDLTPDGLDAMKPVVANADQNAVKVQTALAALATELSDSSSHLSSIAFQTSSDTPKSAATRVP